MEAPTTVIEGRVDSAMPSWRLPAGIEQEENTMKLLIPFGLALLLAGSAGPEALRAAAPERPPNVCINIREIQRTEIPDDRTIIFHMRGGMVWQNKLKTVCPMLRVSPYTQIIHGTDTVCSNQQFIHVIQTGNDCVLGEFTPLPKEAPGP